MLKKIKIKILILLISITIIISYFFINSIIGSDSFKYLKSFINIEQKELIKKYIFPHKVISNQKMIISQQQETISEQYQIISQIKQKIKSSDWSALELLKKNETSEIITLENIIKLSKNKTLKQYQLTSGFYSGINNDFPGSGYIDFYKGNIIVLSSRGILAFKKNIENTEKNFEQIKNNIDEFISINQFKKNKWF